MRRDLLVVLALLLTLTGIIIAWRQWPTSWPTVAEEWWRSLRSPPPTLAKDISCVVLDTVDLSVPCKISHGRFCEMPLSNYKVIGKYADEAQARSALNTINACRRDIFYIVWDITSGLCRILPEEDFLDYEDDEPDRWSDLGHYTSEREAETAFRTFDQCKPIHVARDKKTGFCKIRTFSQDASDLDYERVGDRYWTVEEAEKTMDASESCKHEANGTATITTPNASIASPTSNWQTPEVFDKMANELSVCAAYYEKLSIARPEETQWIFFSKKASGYAALQTELAGLKPETATARYKVALDDMSRRIDKNPTDVSILIADYDDLCNEAMFSPDKRGRYWLERLTTPLQ